MEKLESVLEGFIVEDVAPQGLADRLDELAALFQSIPLFGMLYDVEVEGDVMLFMLIVGLDCCCG